ncbi:MULTISPECIES: NTP-binding protein [Enterobacteriaceae]|uniref:NTP-binding protein n=4 Tax=Enterobacteriaceae TaxID=543 RepID=A0A3S7L7E1_ECOLX|nr:MULTISPECIES: NTP-binding protein [Enterobacteriaceae]ARZ79860.1 NTP-binding protein [Enterobacter cloacae complex sp.]ATW94826.1 NTP-binding protein [Enterobacter sp. CRENT-193]AWM65412.1 NTP-binding protein [Escherichia coli]ECY7465358.1 NTP-binding protein [Salmonella enterica subsp. enterica serovar Poona]KAA1140076.1 NTP-binding protein [Citrobacter portucalensis]HAE1467483.1 NTP-binding protein [Salmonella enterica subsp. enterica serovar Infantis]HAU6425036.1 NTP-binding protein [C
MVQMTSDIALSGVACTSGVTPRQLVQSSSENDNYHGKHCAHWYRSG